MNLDDERGADLQSPDRAEALAKALQLAAARARELNDFKPIQS